jgi:hypothetical protein
MTLCALNFFPPVFLILIFFFLGVKQMCGSVEWIPERPRELVSGGCDATLLHTDVARDEVVSRQNLGIVFSISVI